MAALVAVAHDPAAPLAAADSAVTSWYDGRHQHVVYVGSDAHVHELLFEVGVVGAVWVHNDLNNAVVSPAAPAVPLAAADSALTSWYDGRHQHVAYLGGPAPSASRTCANCARDYAQVHELLFEVGVVGARWEHEDLITAATR